MHSSDTLIKKLNSKHFIKLRGMFLCKKIVYTCLPHFFHDLDVLEIAYLPPSPSPHLLSVYWMSERESEILAVKGLKPCYLRPGRLCIWVSSAPVTGCRLRLRPGGGARPGQAGPGATTKFQDGLCRALTRPGPFSRICEPQHNLTNNSSAPGVASDHLDRGRK